MILVRGLRLYPGEDAAALIKRSAKQLRISPEHIESWKLVRKSLDARRKDDIHYVCSLAVGLGRGEEQVLRRAGGPDVCRYEPFVYEIPAVEPDTRPVIAGFGPAGMFAALVLAKAGARPIVIERGQDVDSRLIAVESFRAGGELDPESNALFGEGGAGTFSDGKLNTGIHDPRMAWVLEQFAAHGAPENILYDAKPHVGTDILAGVVKNFRREIIALGGLVRFGARLDRLIIQGGRLAGVSVRSGGREETLPCSRLILATGHSARDLFETLYEQNVPMEAKPFSMGARIEHRQADIDLAQYGRERGALPPADYSLHARLPSGGSAYTFCMCPGGQVFASASERGGVVTNGMSLSGRGGENANSALLVTLGVKDFPGPGPLAGMYWQRQIERAAFEYGGGDYRAPAQLVGDFLSGRPSAGPGAVKPTYRPGVVWGDLRRVLPERICSVLAQALPELDKRLRGFAAPDAVLTGPETRSSSPVRILRGGDLCSPVYGLYPCGEGAGYAGGISSAAVDGMRCAEAVIKSLSR